jgi:hypothetical protein
MTAGYGRGYYGAGQLAPKPPQPRRSGGWIKLAAVVGVGAAVWFLWPRKPKLDYDDESGGGGNGPGPPTLPPAPPPPERPLAQSFDSGVPLDQEAQARGYSSQQAYEDAVVASARQLQDTGARVTFAPHFQHLTRRLGP